MSVAEWRDTYDIHHWRILWSRYRKLAWVGFAPTTTEFHSDALTDWAIRPWIQLALRANFVQLLQFHLFVQCQISFRLLHSSSRHVYLIEILKLCRCDHMSVTEWRDTYGIHHGRILWSSYRKLAWVRFEPTTAEFCSDALTNWAIRQWVVGVITWV